MKVLVTTEHRFERTPDGAVWTGTVYDYPYWKNYLAVFDEVKVLARVKEVESVPGSYHRADGPGVSFAAIPYYVGPIQYCLRLPSLKQAVKNIYQRDYAVILVNGNIAVLLEYELRKKGHPFGIEVIGDPYDTFAPGSISNPLRSFFRWRSSQLLRKQCATACAVAYVTATAFQKRYPPSPGAYSTHFSNIVLHEDDFVTKPRNFIGKDGAFSIITVGTMDLLYKAQDILLPAVAQCIAQGILIRLLLVGDGRYRPQLESAAEKLGIHPHTLFLGSLPGGEAVRRYLDQADLFVLPSRQEGLPRAMVEAMARGLPCIGSTVGGIPELLPPEDLVPPNDVEALAQKIMEVVGDPERLARMSRRNWEKAKEYRNEVLQVRRVAFYKYVKEKTQEWLAEHRQK
jgi:glycosyltransferase involved in cell wall biosynthesis